MYILKVDGSTEEMTDTSLEAKQKAVGGYIQILPTNDGGNIIVDEEGKYKMKEVNEKANELVTEIGLSPLDMIVGDVIIVKAGELLE